MSLAIEETPVEGLDTLLRDVKGEVHKLIVGHDLPVELLLTASIAGGHVLLEGPPGVAKTLLSGAVARALGSSFTRIQFTPDTAPRHIVGETVFKMGEPVFLPGVIFTNMVLADEINRTPPRTQAALLEAMQEHHVTVDGKMHWLPSPFMVVATQNPYEQEGVFPLPESQLDRFLFKVDVSYGSEAQELEMLQLPHRGLTPEMIGEVRPVLDPVRIDRAQRQLDATEMPQSVARFIVSLVRATRRLPGVVLGASPRAAIHLSSAAKAAARLAGRVSVERDDVVRMAPYVLGHRIVAGPEAGDVVAAAVDVVLADEPG